MRNKGFSTAYKGLPNNVKSCIYWLDRVEHMHVVVLREREEHAMALYIYIQAKAETLRRMETICIHELSVTYVSVYNVYTYIGSE